MKDLTEAAVVADIIAVALLAAALILGWLQFHVVAFAAAVAAACLGVAGFIIVTVGVLT
jgi:hypothetical protein